MKYIEAVFNQNYISVILAVFLLLFAIKEIIDLISYFKKKGRIKTGFDQDKENVENRLITLEKHDKWQYKEISKMSKGIENIESELLDNNLERKRRYILDFCSSLSNGQKQNKEAFNNVFKTYKKYEELLSAHNMENGQAEESMKFISEKYQEFLRNGKFK